MKNVNGSKHQTMLPLSHLQKHYEEQLGFVLEQAALHGATGASASISAGRGLTVGVRKGDVDTIEHENDKTLSLTVYVADRTGSASSTDLSTDALENSVKTACAIARQAHRDEYAGLADVRHMARSVPDLDLYHPWACSPQQAVALCAECEQAALDQDPRVDNSDGALLSTWSGVHVYGNSHGFIGGWPSSQHSLSCTVIARDKQGNMQRDGWYSSARDHHDLDTPQAIGEQAGQRCIKRLGARMLPTQRVPVLFEAPVADGLFADFVDAISGKRQYQRTSFLLDRKGQLIFPENLHIQERPHLSKAQGSAPFDNDGVATRERDMVRGGILQDYALSVYSARRLGLSPTGNGGGVHNLTVESGQSTLPELIKTMGTGLLVTELIGFGTNPVTGDYSQGACGFWVEHGEIQYPVEEITVAGTLREMYRQIVAIGNDVDLRGNILTGSVLIESMTVAGK